MEATGARDRAGDAAGVGRAVMRRDEREHDLEREIRPQIGLGKIDAASMGAAIAILSVVFGIAAHLPARRTSLVDPTTALRYE